MDMGLQTRVTDVAYVPRVRASRATYVTIAQICRRLDVTSMTLMSWREGTPGRRPLPYITEERGKRHRVLIAEGDLVRYLQDYRPDLAERWTSRQ